MGRIADDPPGGAGAAICAGPRPIAPAAGVSMDRFRMSLGTALLAAVVAASAVAQPPALAPAGPPVLPMDAAVRFALEHNPQLAVARTQRGLAQAGVVLARTYPYNPVYNGVILGVSGPDVANHVFNEHYVVQQLEIRGQGRQRRAAAAAAL